MNKPVFSSLCIARPQILLKRMSYRFPLASGYFGNRSTFIAHVPSLPAPHLMTSSFSESNWHFGYLYLGSSSLSRGSLLLQLSCNFTDGEIFSHNQAYKSWGSFRECHFLPLFCYTSSCSAHKADSVGSTWTDTASHNETYKLQACWQSSAVCNRFKAGTLSQLTRVSWVKIVIQLKFLTICIVTNESEMNQLEPTQAKLDLSQKI